MLGRSVLAVLLCSGAFMAALLHVINAANAMRRAQAREIQGLRAELQVRERLAERPGCTALDEAPLAPLMPTSGTAVTTPAPVHASPAPAVSEVGGLGQSPSSVADLASIVDGLSADQPVDERIASARSLLRITRAQTALAALDVLLEADVDEGLGAAEVVISTAASTPAGTSVALRALARVAESDDKLAQEFLRSYRDHDNPMLRMHAAKLLRDRGEQQPFDRLVRELVAGLDSGDATSRARAVSRLGFLQDAATVPELARMVSDEDPVVRARAVRSLARFDQSAAREAVAAALEDPSPTVRELAWNALAKEASWN